MADSVQYIASLVDRFSGPMRQMQNQVQNFNSQLGNVNRNSAKTTSSVGGLGAVIGKLGGLMAVGTILAGAGAIAKMGMGMEQTRVQFETFLGSAEKGNAVIADLQKFSLATPFEDEQVLKAGKSLLAFGTQAKDLEKTLSVIGNISSATGKDFNELTTIYGKAQIAGTLYAEDINQLVEAGIPVMDLFAKQLGVGTDQVKKMASEGKLTFGMFQKAFEDLGGEQGRWGDLMDKQSKTLGGRLSSLMGTAKNLGATLGEMAIPMLGSIVDAGNTLTTFINSNKKQFGEMFRPLMDAVQPIISAFRQIAQQMGITADAGGFLTTVFNGIATVIKIVAPFIKMLAQVVGTVYTSVFSVVKAFAEWYDRTVWIQKGVKTLYLGFKYAFEDIATMASKIFGGIGDIIAGVFNADFSQIKRGVAGVGDGLYKNSKETAEQARRMKEDWNKPMGGNLFGSTPAGGTTSATALAKSGAAMAAANGGKADAKTNARISSAIGSATGSKSNTYNITINKLIENFTTQFTSMEQSKENIKKMVEEALTGAVSDLTTNLN